MLNFINDVTVAHRAKASAKQLHACKGCRASHRKELVGVDREFLVQIPNGEVVACLDAEALSRCFAKGVDKSLHR